MGYFCAKFQVSSFNGLSVKMSRTHPRDRLVDLIKGRKGRMYYLLTIKLSIRKDLVGL